MKSKILMVMLALLGTVLLCIGPVRAAEPTRKSPPIAAPSQPIYTHTPQEWSWSGAYLDLGVGGQATLMELQAATGGGTAYLDGLGAWDWAGNARVGLNYHPTGSPFVLGVFAGYSIGSTEVNAGVTGLGNISAEMTPTWDVGAIVGWVGPNKSLLYVGPRYQQAEFDLHLPASLATACTKGLRCSDTVGGYGFVAGFKMPITPAFTAGIEYGYQKFDDVHLISTPDLKVDLEPEVHTVMFRGSVLLGPNLFRD